MYEPDPNSVGIGHRSRAMQEYVSRFLSKGQRPLIIRDPVHNYIELSPIERDLIDTQIFQRLRFVSQNSTAFYTYPSNFSARFQHSIGAAHLAGNFVSAALRSSDRKTVEQFLDAVRDLIEEVIRGTDIDPKVYIKKYSLEGIVWQLTRLVLLLHDIGHPPFSHLTEHAIEPHFPTIFGRHVSEQEWQQHKANLAYHEFVSLMLISHDDGIQGVFKDLPGYPRKLFLELVKKTFDPEGQRHSAVHAIHGIMSGEIDADRGDYVLRDGRNSGVEFGNYDIARMADFMRLNRKDAVFEFIPMELALSSVETFLSERYKLYKWVIFHQHVTQTDTALQHAIHYTLKLFAAGDRDIQQILDITRLRYDRYIVSGSYSDDVWMWNVLREVYGVLKDRQGHDTEHKFLLRLLECSLHRLKLAPLWKTPIEYQSFSRQDFGTAFLKAIYKRYESDFKHKIEPVNAPSQSLVTGFHKQLSLNLVAKHYLEYDSLKTLDLESSINAGFSDFWIILQPKRFVPIKLYASGTESFAKILTKEGQAPSLINFSASVKALTSAWEQDIHLFAFAVPLDGLKVDIKQARKRFIDGFLKWYARQDRKFPGSQTTN